MEEGVIHAQGSVIANHQPAIIAQPGKGPFHLPSFVEATHHAPVVERRRPAALAMRTDQEDASIDEPLAQWIAVVTPVGNDPQRSLLRPAWTAAWNQIASRVVSANFTSAGEALVRWLPKGTPWPSTTTIHFVPLPRLVLPIPSPLFCRSEAAIQKALLPIQPPLAVQFIELLSNVGLTWIDKYNDLLTILKKLIPAKEVNIMVGNQ
jgi:hypothetical protein